MHKMTTRCHTKSTFGFVYFSNFAKALNKGEQLGLENIFSSKNDTAEYFVKKI